MLAAPIAGKRALGGPVEKGRRYVVGEQGREEFVPEQDGKIVPHGELERRRAARGSSTTIHVGQIVVEGASDPQSTARAVRTELRRMAAGQSTMLSD